MLNVAARLGLGDPLWLDPTIAVAIFLISLAVAVLLHKIIFPIASRLSRRTATDLGTRLFQAIRLPLTFGVVLLGGYLALTVPLDLSELPQNAVDTVARLLAILLVLMAVASLIANACDWYIEVVSPRTQSGLDDKLLPLLRRIAVPLVYGIGGVMLMGQLGISIGPLIAGLGLGGLAVALAIQPTLANIFAGTYVMTEGVISPGDYIELEGGIAGYVVGVSWRSTRIRTWGNNLVVIPNSKFAETIVTNYQQPFPAVNVYLTCGVSYDSDLYHVERVSLEVMNEVLDTNPDAIKEYGAWFGYQSFGESNVNFWLFLQSKDRLGSFVVQSDLVQRLHARFRKEGIVINYPVRTLQFPKEWGPELAVGRGLRHQTDTQSDAAEDGGGDVEGTKLS